MGFGIVRSIAGVALAGLCVTTFVLNTHSTPRYLSVCVIEGDSVAGDHACVNAPQYSDGPEGANWAGWHYFLETERFPQVGESITDPLWRIDE